MRRVVLSLIGTALMLLAVISITITAPAISAASPFNVSVDVKGRSVVKVSADHLPPGDMVSGLFTDPDAVAYPIFEEADRAGTLRLSKKLPAKPGQWTVLLQTSDGQMAQASFQME